MRAILSTQKKYSTNRIRVFGFLVGLLWGLFPYYSSGQVCLDGWSYRKKITFDNSQNSTPLDSFQVSFTLNTKVLIQSGKMNPDGSDIRILDHNSNPLPFSINRGTINTSLTKVWTRITHINAGSLDSVFVFYGSPGAADIQNPEATFELYDQFDSTSLDSSKWDFCNGGNLNVSNGEMTMSSSGLNTEKSTIFSRSTIQGRFISEFRVTGVSNGRAFIGQVNHAGNGYGMTFETIAGFTTMRIMAQNSSGYCLDLTDLPVIEAEQALNTDGIWSFSWFKQDSILFNWPGSDSVLFRYGSGNILGSDIRTTIGIQDKNGSLSIDWVRVRKYSKNEPLTFVGQEITIHNPVLEAETNSPVCEEDSIILNARVYPHLAYIWYGPNSFVAPHPRATIPSLPVNSGFYALHTSDSAGCHLNTYYFQVKIGSFPDPGIISSDTTVCASENRIPIVIKGYQGKIDRWETTDKANGLWSTISSTNDTLILTDITRSAYYKTRIRKGSCYSYSDSVFIQVDSLPKKGEIAGNSAYCKGDSVHLNLIQYSGTPIYWSKSGNNGQSWSRSHFNQNSISEHSMEDRFSVFCTLRNGVCPEVHSDTLLVHIHPVPTVDFEVNDSCTGIIPLYNLSSVATGTLVSHFWQLSNTDTSNLFQPNHSFDPGHYMISLTEKSNFGCTNQVSKPVQIHPVPTPRFSFNTPCQQDSITFIHSSSITSGSVMLQQWSFGNGKFAETNPAATVYESDSTFHVRLSLSSDQGCSAIKDSIITIHPKPESSFDPIVACVGDSIRFMNRTSAKDSTWYEWRFGDGASSFLENPVYFYSRKDTFDVMLAVRSAFGCMDTAIGPAFIYQHPIASFSTLNHCLHDSVTFLNTSKTSSLSSFFWTFGDSTTSTNSYPFHHYKYPNIYSVNLSVTDEHGCKDSINSSLRILKTPEADYFSGNACSGNSVLFTNTTTADTALTFIWEFGDGTRNHSHSPSHRYSNDSIYTVRLIASYNNFCPDTLTGSIHVHPTPTAAFTAGTVCLGDSTLFSNQSFLSGGSLIAYNWEFGDGNMSLSVNPKHRYEHSGVYPVKLLAISDSGCFAYDSIYVHVIQPPDVGFTSEVRCLNESALCLNQTTPLGNNTYLWDFGDSFTSTVPSPFHAYSDTGIYTISLTATSSDGCMSTLNKLVHIFPLPEISTLKDTAISKGMMVTLAARGGMEYRWSPTKYLDNPFIDNPIATPDTTTTYTVTSFNANGCKNIDSITVVVNRDYYLNIYNIITPDHNGQNDVWVIDNIQSYPVNSVHVFDQLGKQVFSTSNYQNDWNGSLHGEPLPDGSYYYLITLDEGKYEQRGVLTLIRNGQ